MTTVFIAGSIKIKKLAPEFIERIANIVRDNMNILVGDANGADSSIQSELFRQNAQNVTVFCSDNSPRNNIGSWKFKQVHSTAPPGSRAFFTAKDLAMAAKADYGLMLWDCASTGTLSNVLELLAQDKKSAVYINRDKSFVVVKQHSDLLHLVSLMSDGAKKTAERKIGLSKRLSLLANKQFGFAL